MAADNKPKYYLVEASVLPEIFAKVIEAKELLETGQVRTVADAVACVDISRSAFYKYKDFVSPFQDMSRGHLVTFNLELLDRQGVLSSVTAFREARRHLPETVDPDRIFLAGDSAGGHLAITAALKLADEFKQKPAGLILFYPVTTLEPGINGSWLRYGRGFTNDSRLMEAFQDAYCPNLNQRRERFVSPLMTDLSALPPFLLITAECDVLSDQGREFAERARRQGVRVIHEELPGAVHIFITMPGMEQAYRTAFEQTLSFLKQFPAP